MRLPIALAMLLVAQPAAADAPSSGDYSVHFDVPQNMGPQHLNALIREFPVGGSSGWHTHPGIEIAYLIEGEMTLETEMGVRRLKPGDNFLMPRGVPHNGANIGKVPVRLLVTYVLDKGAPVRTMVDPPHRH